VLLFYPFDFSPVCTEELCTFRDSEWLGFNPNLDVFGVSTDSAFAHREVIHENDLPFPLLSDHDGTVSKQYDVLYDELENHKRVSKRAVFVIDDTATIRYAWEAEEWLTDPDIEAINESIQAIEGIGF
jgi:peroxiredoxin